MRLPQISPYYTDDVSEDFRRYFTEARGWITEDRYTREFEAALLATKHSRYCRVVSNGTVALTLILKALGFPKGRTILVPAYTMGGSVSSIVEAGLIPKFCDIEPETLCIDAESVKREIDTNTVGVMLVSMNGRYPRSAATLREIAEDKSLVLVEDGAQSLCSTHDGAPYFGGAVACATSFSMPKIITTGNGGAIFTEHESLIKKVGMLADFGRKSRGNDIYELIGSNSKFTDLQAVFGLNQLKDIDFRVQKKQQLFEWYDSHSDLKKYGELLYNRKSEVPMFIEYLLPSGEHRNMLGDALGEVGIGSRNFYPDLSRTPAFSCYRTGSVFPVASDVSQRGLWLPSSIDLTADQVETICNEICKILSR